MCGIKYHTYLTPPSSHCHVVTHCCVLHSLSCPIHHSLLPSHLSILVKLHSPHEALLVLEGDKGGVTKGCAVLQRLGNAFHSAVHLLL
jgi:hypothetical protein